MHEQSQRIRKTEADNIKLGRKRTRGWFSICIAKSTDLQSFRSALSQLQRLVDELDALKAEYHEEVLIGEDEVSAVSRLGCKLISDVGHCAFENGVRRAQSA